MKVKKLVKCKIYIKQKMVQSWLKLILNSQQPIRSIICKVYLYYFYLITFNMTMFIIMIKSKTPWMKSIKLSNSTQQ